MTQKQARRALSLLVKPTRVEGHINAIKELNGGRWSGSVALGYIKQIEASTIIG